ncbi:MAG: peptide chain release factor N(5)-glutamine methyltransferase [Hyphomonas sp.]|jgi:release factor glutamine methyltransferase
MTAPTYDALIREAAERFRAAGIDEARPNAMMLMLHVFGDTRAALIAAGNAPVPKALQEKFLAAVERRLKREPLQHILGTTHFYGLEFRSDPRALIPRIDSEVVAETALSLIHRERAEVIADLGTGTGCLLGAILWNRPLAVGTGVEADPAAASLARENFDVLGLSGRASVFEGRWSDWTGWRGADLIISNPPYIASAEIESLAPEVRDHDPLVALDGGADGLRAYREIVRLAGERMKAGAWLVMEIGHDQRAAVQSLLAAAGFAEMGHRADLGGNDRCVWGRAAGSVR